MAIITTTMPSRESIWRSRSNNRTDITDTEPIYIYVAGTNPSGNFGPGLVEFQHIPIFHHKNVIFRDADGLCQFRMQAQVTVFTVNRQEKLRFDNIQQ